MIENSHMKKPKRKGEICSDSECAKRSNKSKAENEKEWSQNR